MLNMDAIKQIESSGNPNAFNKKSGAVGHYQITPIVVADYNLMNPKAKIKLADIKDPGMNQAVAEWYSGVRIPQLLSAYKVPVTLKNVLAAYSAGAGAVRAHYHDGHPLPKETIDYFRKYTKLTGVEVV